MTTPTNPWHARAEELADWALERLFVRRDRYGGYYCAEDETRKCARPKDGAAPRAVRRSVVLRHFRATRTDDVIGAYFLTPEPACVGRAVAVDIDAHDGTADPERNWAYAEHLHRKLVGLGFRPLLARWGGSCHLYALFAADVPGGTLHTFGRSLVTDAALFGFGAIETFPKQPSVPAGGFGNWLRVVGRHHTRPEWARVFDGRTWLDGAAAVAHVLSLTGDSMPPAVCVDPEPEPDPLPPARAATFQRPELDLLAEYSRSVTLHEVVCWHERAGHRVTRRKADRVEFVRAGKTGGESFNVLVIDGVPITYNFSSNAGIPAARGLSPAQVRCFYETGSCDPAALCRFADGLRAALGLPPRRAPRHNSTGTAEERLAAIERRCEQLARENWELAQAVLDLREQIGRGAFRGR